MDSLKWVVGTVRRVVRGSEYSWFARKKLLSLSLFHCRGFRPGGGQVAR